MISLQAQKIRSIKMSYHRKIGLLFLSYMTKELFRNKISPALS